MSNQSIKYGILLTKEQLDFLKDDRQGFHRMTAFGTFVSMASTKPSVYLKTGFSASLSIGQFAISTVELSALDSGKGGGTVQSGGHPLNREEQPHLHTYDTMHRLLVR